MKYPRLIQDFGMIPCHLVIYGEDTGEYGEPIVILEKDAKCKFVYTESKTFETKKYSVQIKGKCYFDGDIAPEIYITDGYIEIEGRKRRIMDCIRGRNPDGSVNYTRIDVE